MNHLEKSLEAFFSSEAKVVVIKGDWGVGKTFFWDNYISKRIESGDLTQLAYSYISLFGSSSLDDVRRRVFHNAKEISSDEKIHKAFDEQLKKSSSLFNKIPWFSESVSKVQRKAPWINWFSKNAQNIPFVNKFSGMISSLEYSLVNNYIICLDDMERKGKGLTVKEIMGLVDELVQRKSCKVVLIFNESSFDNDEDRAQFQSYREKVVDVEIHHNPTCRENISCIFSIQSEKNSVLEKTISHLQIKNIRVLRKIKWTIEYFEKFIGGKDQRIVDELIVHSILLCWSYYIRDLDLSYELLKKQLSSNSWLSYFFDENKEISVGEKKYRALASGLNLRSSVFDNHITFFLENGYVDDAALSVTVREFEDKVRLDSVSSRLRDAWNIYSESFSDNLDDFKKKLIDIMNEDIDRVGLPDFSSAVDILEEFGEDVTDFVNRYVEINADSLSKVDSRHSLHLQRFRCPLLKEKIEALHAGTKNYNIDEVAMRIAENDGWNTEDIEFLNSLSKDDYLKWMKGNPENIATKIRAGLLTFQNIRTSNGDQGMYDNISRNVIAALKEIAEENELNKYRVRSIYGIE